jgi:hypothetical protein
MPSTVSQTGLAGLSSAGGSGDSAPATPRLRSSISRSSAVQGALKFAAVTFGFVATKATEARDYILTLTLGHRITTRRAAIDERNLELRRACWWLNSAATDHATSTRPHFRTVAHAVASIPDLVAKRAIDTQTAILIEASAGSLTIADGTLQTVLDELRRRDYLARKFCRPIANVIPASTSWPADHN